MQGARPLDERFRTAVDERVRASPLFAGTGLEATHAMLQGCPVVRIDSGERLLDGGQLNRQMFVVLSGRLSVRLEGPDSAVIATLHPGETVGELSLLDRQPTSAWVTAETPTELLAMDEATFWRVVCVSHSFCVRMMLRLSERLRSSNAIALEHSELARRFERAATFDTLTGARSRRWVEDTLPRILERHRRSGSPLTVAMLDLDHFKRINDTLGHLAGDAVLSAVGELLTGMLRPGDAVARFGGEEFLVVLPGTSLADGLLCVERLRARIETSSLPLPGTAGATRASVSVGLSALEPNDSVDSLLARADRALYRAKEWGRNRCEALPCLG